ncbi:L,D-transpeptidase family protein [Cellulosimicrobium marinum]|uniref:L,D-transpeptidase family protein n=1 Tax=Cellulosimicrobium marinum TaxID=1638992 RepID=UPI001E4CB727|nr:L,D-transpeptidase family protein [Cellulosimicrobium marinum]MCB7136810.1 L,D-transpeptidase family protein [Cellulosimicrobium marinum]
MEQDAADRTVHLGRPGASRERRRRRTRRTGTALVLAATLVVLSGCQAGWPDMEPGRAPSADAASSGTATPDAGGTAGTSAPSTTDAPTPTETTTTETTTEPTPSETPDPAPSDTPDPAPSPTAEESTPPPTTEPTPPAEPATLQRGATGDRVRVLQERLAELGYFIPPPDGAFGPGTQQAVWALQKAAGISRDGVVGPATQAALDEGVRPAARSGAGKVVEIDLNRQLLLAVEDGRVVTVVNASTGNGETFEAKGRTYRAGTPRGTFAVGRQVDANYESSLELGSMWRPKFFTGGIAVHGSPSIPPWPASHGCVRVANGAMNWIWDSWGAPPGTTVLVY